MGGVDIIGQDGETLVFVEVKLRGSHTFGAAVEAITRAKAQKLVMCAQQYASERNLDIPWRIDIVAIQMDSGVTQPTLIQNAVADETA